MADTFRYQALNPDRKEIRVLKLDLEESPYHEQTTHFSRPLKCHIQHISLLAEPITPFNAISYCWGTNPATEQIRINDQTFHVPATAVAALRGIFLSDHEIPSESISATEDRTYHTREALAIPVWIDALCINQADMQEKGAQISLMGDIYSLAEKVLIWLGEATNTTECGIRSILTCYETCKAFTNDFASPSETAALRRKDDPAHVFSHLRQPIPESCDKQALMTFYSSPWFRRLWVFQEVVLANFAIIFQGPFALPWFAAATVASWISKGLFQAEWGGSFSAQAGAGLVHASRALLATANASNTFEVLLMAGASFETSSPYDQVYGLLGLAKVANSEAVALQALRPGYSKALAVVYAEATLAAIQANQSLWLLQFVHWGVPKDCYRHRQTATDEFPSWVPRFDMVSNAQTGSPAVIPISFRQDASGGTALHLDLNPLNVKTLKVCGIVVDEVKTRSELIAVIEQPQTYSPMRTLGPFFVDSCRAWYLVPENTQGQPWSEIMKAVDRSKRLRMLKSFALAAAAGQTMSEQDARTDESFFADFAAFMIKYFDTYRISCPERLASLLQDLGSDQGNYSAFEQAVLNNSFHRPLFTTKDGKCGLGAQGMQTGDIVCILFGSKVPLLLRRCGESWRFVGTGYMDCLMSGEYVKQLQRDDRLEKKTEWFHIV